MPHIVLDCPHCAAQEMTMQVLHRALTRNADGIAYARCNRCTLPVVAIVRKGPGFRYGTIANWLTEGNDVLEDSGARLVQVIPGPKKAEAPEHVPSHTARVFVQALNAQKRGEFDTAGMAFRKTLDIGLKEYDAVLSGGLQKRIDQLADNHVITQAMRDWAHQIRLLGNEIAHEPEEPTEEEVTAIAYFTETLLKYLFTLPKEVDMRKAATATP